MDRFLLVPQTGTGTAYDPYRPLVGKISNYCTVAKIGLASYIVKFQIADGASQDTSTLADALASVIGETALTNSVKTYMTTWMATNGFADKIAEFNSTVQNRKQLLMYFCKLAGLAVDEQILINGYKT